MEEPLTRVVNITQPKPSSFLRNSITKLNLIKFLIALDLGKQDLEKSITC
jgi:hypothetical protein